jgi:hypothetical protein
MQGKELAKGKGSSTDLSEFPNGVYFLKIEHNISKVFKKQRTAITIDAFAQHKDIDKSPIF